MEQWAKIGLTTHFGCLESYYNSVKTETCSADKLVGFYMGQGIQEWTKQNFWKTAFKKLKVIGST